MGGSLGDHRFFFFSFFALGAPKLFNLLPFFLLSSALVMFLPSSTIKHDPIPSKIKAGIADIDIILVLCFCFLAMLNGVRKRKIKLVQVIATKLHQNADDSFLFQFERTL